jgi:hypothetical protein
VLAIQKNLLNHARLHWARKFPFLTPVQLQEKPSRPVGSNFICDSYYQRRRLVYFVSFEFVPKRSEEITLEITISDSRLRSRQPHGWKSGIETQKIGTYRIGSFLGSQDYWWALADVNTRLTEDSGFDFGAPQGSANVWKPSSFTRSPEIITEDAVKDISAKLAECVFPALSIDLR